MSEGWTDQPSKVNNAKIVFRAYINSRIIEVRDAGKGWYYVTIGNLFGSQSIECASVDVAFKVMNDAAHYDDVTDEQMTLPLGAEAMESPRV